MDTTEPIPPGAQFPVAFLCNLDTADLELVSLSEEQPGGVFPEETAASYRQRGLQFVGMAFIHAGAPVPSFTGAVDAATAVTLAKAHVEYIVSWLQCARGLIAARPN